MLSVTHLLSHVLAQGRDGLPPWWAFAIAGGGLLVVLFVPRWLARRSKVLDDPKRRPTAQEELHHSMDRLLIELQETARDINSTMDTKMIALNRLIEEADRKIETLRSMQEGPSPSPVEKPGPSAERETEEARMRRELGQEICRLADEGKTELEIARMTGSPRGEVELVLSLRKMPGASRRGADTEQNKEGTE